MLKNCPHCGSIMKKRNGKFGAFFGCTGFPKCRHTEKFVSSAKRKAAIKKRVADRHAAERRIVREANKRI